MNEAPFRFRLRSVLRVARAHEQAAQRAMAVETAAEDRARAHAAVCAEAYAAVPAHDQPASADAFRHRAATAALRAEALRNAEAATAEAGERLAAARDEVLSTVSRRRSLEELEERHRSAHALYAARAAQRSLDDLAAVRRSMG